MVRSDPSPDVRSLLRDVVSIGMAANVKDKYVTVQGTGPVRLWRSEAPTNTGGLVSVVLRGSIEMTYVLVVGELI